MDHINNQFLRLVYFFKFRGVYWYHINNQIFMVFFIFSLIWKFQTLSMICCFYFVVIWNWLVNKEFRLHREWGSHRLVLNQGDITLILNTTLFTKMESPKAYMFAADPDYKQSDILTKWYISSFLITLAYLLRNNNVTTWMINKASVCLRELRRIS